ncbi:hypothetical protein NQ176_g10142 [Zarea fungicola]|uniref:Uncharacterized protein n=1 Tax=Zarea fungicola TaxID=93591 RepID=A0ACC1MJK8_9HYPO|nr:hypothetical protein NQ176_g10142 [Lecanicillium fungicola]
MHYFARLEIDRSHVERPSTVSVYIGGDKAGDVMVMPQPAVGIMKGSFAIDTFVHGAFNMTAGSNETVSSIAHLVRMRVTKPDGSIVPVSSISSLKLRLEEIPFTPPASIEELPVPCIPNVHEVEPVEHFEYPLRHGVGGLDVNCRHVL